MEVDRYRAYGNTQTTPRNPQQRPRTKPGDWFVKGPIPGRWIGVAAKLPGKALHVAVAIWHVTEIEKSYRVKFTCKWRNRFSIGPDATRRGLAALESAGLIKVESKAGRAPLVTIQDIS